MVSIKTRSARIGIETTETVPGSIAEVIRALALARGPQVFFGEFRHSIGITVADIVSVEPVVPRPPPVPTKAQCLADLAAIEADRAREQARERAHRARCRGGAEVVLETVDGLRTRHVARPVRDVILDVTFADRDYIHLDDGLGAAATIRVSEVVDIRPLA